MSQYFLRMTNYIYRKEPHMETLLNTNFTQRTIEREFLLNAIVKPKGHLIEAGGKVHAGLQMKGFDQDGFLTILGFYFGGSSSECGTLLHMLNAEIPRTEQEANEVGYIEILHSNTVQKNLNEYISARTLVDSPFRAALLVSGPHSEELLSIVILMEKKLDQAVLSVLKPRQAALSIVREGAMERKLDIAHRYGESSAKLISIHKPEWLRDPILPS